MLNKITNVCTVTLTILACSFATAQSTQWTGWQSASRLESFEFRLMFVFTVSTSFLFVVSQYLDRA